MAEYKGDLIPAHEASTREEEEEVSVFRFFFGWQDRFLDKAKLIVEYWFHDPN